MAERTKLHAYVIFCLTNTLVYSFPAHWVWADNGWLKQLDVVDVAGVGPVHLVGGVTALIAAVMLKPRHGRFDNKLKLKSSNAVNSLLGLFILWWGWLGFNCGSTFGISGGKWKLAAKAAATTIMSSCGGGITAFCISYLFHKRKVDVRTITNGILGSLVSITGICAVTYCWAAIIIGSIGAIIEAGGEYLLIKLKIDDPVGATPVHLLCSVWGLLCCGLFTRVDNIQNMEFAAHSGLFLGGGWYLLYVQFIAVVSIIVWTAIVSFINLKLLDLTIGLRLNLEDELLGADVSEHMCLPPGYTLEELKKHVQKTIQPQSKDKLNAVVSNKTSCLCIFAKSRIVTKNVVEPLSDNTNAEELNDDTVSDDVIDRRTSTHGLKKKTSVVPSEVGEVTTHQEQDTDHYDYNDENTSGDSCDTSTSAPENVSGEKTCVMM